jgi:hypothetical protein
MTFAEFAAAHGLSITAQNVPFRFPADGVTDSQWNATAIHFAATIWREIEGGKIPAWQGCYSVGEFHAIQWAKELARRTSESRIAGGVGNMFAAARLSRESVLRIGQNPRQESVADSEVRQGAIALYREKAPLDVAGVLESLQIDCQGIDGATFEQWAGDLGFDTDSRRALAIFELCRATARNLSAALGADLFAEFMSIEP